MVAPVAPLSATTTQTGEKLKHLPPQLTPRDSRMKVDVLDLMDSRDHRSPITRRSSHIFQAAGQSAVQNGGETDMLHI